MTICSPEAGNVTLRLFAASKSSFRVVGFVPPPPHSPQIPRLFAWLYFVY